MSCRRWQNPLLIVLSVLTLVFLVTNRNIVEWNDEGTEEEKRAVRLFQANYGKNRELESSIRLKDDVYVDIYDGILGTSNKKVIVRQIITKNLRLTAMVLKPPPNISETNFDTATWNIDKETLYFDNYITTMIEEMFLSGKVPMTRRAYAKILDLGLGGGYLNSYLHHNYPNMDITVVEHDPEILKISRKWFDLKEDERHRVMLTDAAQFVRNAAKNRQVYDIIFVDACGTKIKSWIICPNQDFTRYEMADSLAKLLTERGALIMNVLSTDLNFKRLGGQLKTVYGSAFKHCILKQSHSPSNLVMTCTQHPPPEGLGPVYEKFANYEKYGGHVSELFE